MENCLWGFVYTDAWLPFAYLTNSNTLKNSCNFDTPSLPNNRCFAYLFLTDNQDEAYDTTKVHQIIQYNVATDTAIDLIFTGGTNSSFLNFSQ